MLASYGASNLAVQRDRTIDLYLRSKNSTFDRYAAAKEVRAGLSELQKEAVAEIQTMAPQGAAKMFYVCCRSLKTDQQIEDLLAEN